MLNPQQIQHYRDEGYVVVPRLLDPADMARIDATIRQILDAALDPAAPSHRETLELEPLPAGQKPVARRIYNPYEQHETFRDLASDPRILDRVASLIGSDIMLQHSKLNMKSARFGSVVEWHQDLTYFPHTNDDLVTLLIYLDDADEDNGCLRVMPRQHRRYFSHATAEGWFAGMITEAMDAPSLPRPVALAAPAGSVIFMHCLTPHCSLPNTSPRGRRTLIFEYRAADSFPIFYGNGDAVAKAEAMTHLLRGKVAAHARLGGPPPLIPRIRGQTRSLYELQEQTRAAATVPSLLRADNAVAK